MKKLLFLVFLAVPVILTGCGNRPQIQPVQNLVELQTEITRISDELLSGTITPETAQELFEQLQSKYTELTETQLLSRMDELKDMIAQKKEATVKLGKLPDWAEDLGLTLPQRMRLNKAVSKQTQVDTSGYDSFLYVYKGPYEYAMKEAARIASGAQLGASQEFLLAQQLLAEGKHMTGLDTQGLEKGIVYTNHSLTDTKIEYLISVNVDADGTLTIQATNYQQMKSGK